MIIITGSNGFVGKYLINEFREHNFEVKGLDIVDKPGVDIVCDLSNLKRIKQIYNELKPSCIIHTAKIAKSADYCEENLKESYNGNFLTTVNLVKVLLNSNTKFINLSSDYVFNGKKGDYDENDIPYPINYYGINKLMGEEVVKLLKNHLNLRPTVIFGYHETGMNFFMQLFRNLKNGKQMTISIDQISNPTYIHTLTKAIRLCVDKDIQGTYFSTGPESMSRYDLALKISEKLNLDKTLIHKEYTKNLIQIAKRPLNCSSNSNKLQEIIDYRFPKIDENLKHLKGIIDGL